MSEKTKELIDNLEDFFFFLGGGGVRECSNINGTFLLRLACSREKPFKTQRKQREKIRQTSIQILQQADVQLESLLVLEFPACQSG